jgi:hypothetical protein
MLVNHRVRCRLTAGPNMRCAAHRLILRHIGDGQCDALIVWICHTSDSHSFQLIVRWPEAPRMRMGLSTHRRRIDRYESDSHIITSSAA